MRVKHEAIAECFACFSILATSELRKRPGKSEVDNASWDCFTGRKQEARPLKQSCDALSTSLLPGLLNNILKVEDQKTNLSE